MYIYAKAKTQIKEGSVPSEEMNRDMIMFMKPLWQSAKHMDLNTPGEKLCGCTEIRWSEVGLRITFKDKH